MVIAVDKNSINIVKKDNNEYIYLFDNETLDDLLKLNPNLKITMIDESYSTIEADEMLKEQNLSYYKRKEIIDEMASVVILNRYLSLKGGK